MSRKGNYSIVILAVFLALFLLPKRAIAGEIISGRYLKASGNKIVVELNLSASPPPLIIIVQKLPKGTGVINSSPRIKKYNPDKGVAKWLLRGIQPGKHLITMDLNRNLQSGDVKGKIRYRAKNSDMISLEIKK